MFDMVVDTPLYVRTQNSRTLASSYWTCKLGAEIYDNQENYNGNTDINRKSSKNIFLANIYR